MKKLALLLALCMMVQCFSIPAFADEAPVDTPVVEEEGTVDAGPTEEELAEQARLEEARKAEEEAKAAEEAKKAEEEAKAAEEAAKAAEEAKKAEEAAKAAEEAKKAEEAAKAAEEAKKAEEAAKAAEEAKKAEEAAKAAEEAKKAEEAAKAAEEAKKAEEAAKAAEEAKKAEEAAKAAEEAKKAEEAAKAEEERLAAEKAAAARMAYVASGAALYADESAGTVVGTLSAKAVVLILEDKGSVSKVQYVVKEEGSEPELKAAFAKNSDLTAFTVEDLDAWNNASHSVSKEAEGYTLEAVKFAPVEEEVEEPVVEEKASEDAAASEDENKDADEEKGIDEDGNLEDADAKDDENTGDADAEGADIKDSEDTEDADAKDSEGTGDADTEDADADNAKDAEADADGEKAADAEAAASADAAPVNPDAQAADVLAAEDVLDVAGASTEFTIRADGVITQYNGSATIVTVPTSVKLNGTDVGVTGISNTAFSRNTAITDITLPACVTTIEAGCFKGCTALRSINLPNNITQIESEVFSGCTSLRVITGTDSVTYIGPYAFYGCASLEGMALPTALSEINQYTFYGCTSLSTITWPNYLNYIGDYAFAGCTALNNLSLPLVDYIEDYAFMGCTGVQNLVMQDGLIYIGTGAFQNCSGIKAINIPATVMEMGNSVFENCSGATSLSLSAACPEIKNFSFKGCRGLTRIGIPNGVTTIGREAFEGCSSLSVVYTIPASVTTIGNYAFNNVAAGCYFFVYNPSVTLGTDCLGTNTNVFAYWGSTAHSYANAHSGVSYFSLSIVDFVGRCYSMILGRTGDVNGIIYWSTSLASQSKSAADVVAGFIRSTEFKNRGLSNDQIIDLLYKVMMDHPGDAQGKAYWTDILNSGMSFDYVVNGFATSSEFAAVCRSYGMLPGSVAITENRDRNKNVTAFVVRCYQIIQNRAYDVQGLNYWTGRILDGTTSGAELVDGFITSWEFRSRNLPIADQVEILYKTMLNRASDAQGKSYWMNKMNNGMSLRAIVNGFASSFEFGWLCRQYGINPGSIALESRDKNPQVTAFVNRNYQEALGRQGEAQGLNYWTDIILNRTQTPLEVAKGFLNSYEFRSKNLGNSDFLKTLYRLFMGREYDAQGLNFWLNQMSKGLTRDNVMDGFGNSKEFTNIVKQYGLN